MKQVDLVCMYCTTPFVGPSPYCCDGYMCGCQGQPTEPIVCSEECYHFLIDRKVRFEKIEQVKIISQ